MKQKVINMKAPFSFICSSLLSVLGAVYCENLLPDCKAWSSIENRLKENDGEIKCTKNSLCTGMNCSSSENGKEFYAGLQVYPCDNPKTVELFVHVPDFNVNQWHKNFSHGDKFQITGYVEGELNFHVSNSSFIIGLDINLVHDKSSYFSKIFGSSLKMWSLGNVTVPVSRCNNDTKHLNQNVKLTSTVLESGHIDNSLSALPKSERDIHKPESSLIKSNCTISNSTCPENEICQQLDRKHNEGVCTCIASYTRDQNGKCFYNPGQSTTDNPSHTDSKNVPGSTTSTSFLLTAILVPIVVLMMLVALTFGIIKFRVCQYLRRRLRVQVYEHVLLGQEEDTDEPLTDPVA